MAVEFNIGSFITQWLFAIVLVFSTYNPSNDSYASWVLRETSTFGPIMALIGVVLLIAWIIFLRATVL